MSPSKNNSRTTLRERALQTNKTNPSQLGDLVSLKAETSSTSPTPEDRGASASNSKFQAAKETLNKVAPAPTEGDQDGGDGKKTLRQRAMDKLQENPSQLGDPISLKAETTDKDPTETGHGSGDSKNGKSKL